MWGDQYTVDLETHACSCRRWDLCGIPCHHAVACIYFRRLKPEDFVNDLYQISTYKKIYEPSISPMTGFNTWDHGEKLTLLPPVYNKLPGRPKKLRKINRDKPIPAGSLGKRHQKSLRCGKCFQWGHNARRHKKEELGQSSGTQPTEVQDELTQPSSEVPFSQPSQQLTQSRTTPMQASSVLNSNVFNTSGLSQSHTRPNKLPVQRKIPTHEVKRSGIQANGPLTNDPFKNHSIPKLPPVQKMPIVQINSKVSWIPSGSSIATAPPTVSSPNPRGWLLTGSPQTTSQFKLHHCFIKVGESM